MEERVIQRGKKDEKNGDMETFLCITHTNTKVSDTESLSYTKGMGEGAPSRGSCDSSLQSL